MRSFRANTALEQRSLFRVSLMSLESTLGRVRVLLCGCYTLRYLTGRTRLAIRAANSLSGRPL